MNYDYQNRAQQAAYRQRMLQQHQQTPRRNQPGIQQTPESLSSSASKAPAEVTPGSAPEQAAPPVPSPEQAEAPAAPTEVPPEASQDVAPLPEVPVPGTSVVPRKAAKSAGGKKFTCDLDGLLDRIWAVRKTKELCVQITKKETLYVVEAARKVFASNPMLLAVKAPVTICGDIHGHFLDVLRIFNAAKTPPETSYLFLGDYVDRGSNSIEAIILLLIYKIKFPDTFHLLRGNHETMRVNSIYGFMAECTTRYPKFGEKVYIAFNNCFAEMPVAAVVEKRIFCVHGGIPKNIISLQEIENLKREKDPSETGMISQLLWSDPNREMDEWKASTRGAGNLFGPTQLKEFLLKFDLDLLARAHEIVLDGYEFFGNRTCVTIFSAPKYCGMENAAAMMRVAADLTCSFSIIRPITEEFPETRVEHQGLDEPQPGEETMQRSFAKTVKDDLSGAKVVKKKKKCTVS